MTRHKLNRPVIQIKSNQIFIAPLQQNHNMAIVYKLQYMDIYTYTRDIYIQTYIHTYMIIHRLQYYTLE